MLCHDMSVLDSKAFGPEKPLSNFDSQDGADGPGDEFVVADA